MFLKSFNLQFEIIVQTFVKTPANHAINATSLFKRQNVCKLHHNETIGIALWRELL